MVSVAAAGLALGTVAAAWPTDYPPPPQQCDPGHYVVTSPGQSAATGVQGHSQLSSPNYLIDVCKIGFGNLHRAINSTSSHFISVDRHTMVDNVDVRSVGR